MASFKELQKQAAEASADAGPKKKGSAWAEQATNLSSDSNQIDASQKSNLWIPPTK